MTPERHGPLAWSSRATSPERLPSGSRSRSQQEMIIREGIERAGYPALKAEQAASAFDRGARAEWQRITGSMAAVWGNA